MYKITVQLKTNSTYSLRSFIRKNDFFIYHYNNISKEINAIGKEEVIPLMGCNGTQFICVYNGDVLPEAIHEILKRLEGEDRKVVVSYSLEYVTE